METIFQVFAVQHDHAGERSFGATRIAVGEHNAKIGRDRHAPLTVNLLVEFASKTQTHCPAAPATRPPKMLDLKRKTVDQTAATA
jgi:hypothetical protein